MAAAELPGIYVLDVLNLARRWKVRPDALLAGTGLTEEGLRDPNARVAVATCAKVVERAHALTGEPALALYQGMQMKVSSHGFLGFAAMTASTVGEALAFAERFAATRTPVLGISSVREQDTAAIVIEERADLGGLREFAILAIMIGVWQLGQTFTGRTLRGVAECAFPEPAYIRRVPFAIDMLRFDRPAHRLVFAAELLDVPLVSADPVAVQLAQAQCERELAMLVDAGLPGRVKRALAADAGDGGFRSVEEVARTLHVSTRTLKRKLAALGTSYTAILDETRRQRALLLLEDRGLPLAEIAGRLGYTELPNFTRAFRKWTGTTPAAYRRRAG
ncbi:MAG TPA: AraC family transcriptional regulator ligand-binding domain-containing protein [Kofleriaceae bacterium]|nr:AraC family transcriptional regulator ligand-binding domain-containing protein [Kofleriaceae bacterium]